MFSGDSKDHPSSIEGEKEGEVEGKKEEEEEEGEEEEGLGFFEPVDSDDSETREEEPSCSLSKGIPHVEARWDEERSKLVFGPSPLCTYVW